MCPCLVECLNSFTLRIHLKCTKDDQPNFWNTRWNIPQERNVDEHKPFLFSSTFRGVLGHTHGDYPWVKIEDYAVEPMARLVGMHYLFVIHTVTILTYLLYFFQSRSMNLMAKNKYEQQDLQALIDKAGAFYLINKLCYCTNKKCIIIFHLHLNSQLIGMGVLWQS